MRESRRRLLQQFEQMARTGELGDSVQQAQEEYSQLSSEIAVMVKVVSDFYVGLEELDEELRNVSFLTFQLLVAAHREATPSNPEVATAFMTSFIEDFPGAPESCLTAKWSSLARASLALQAVAHGSDWNLIWQQSLKLSQAYNEFLNGLFGYLITLWRAKEGRSVNPRVHRCTYADKVKQLIALTGGDDGPFYLLLRLARPKLRNAIAHENIWLDPESAVVHYTDVRTGTEDTIPLSDFMALVSAGSHLAQAYLAALAAIALLEEAPDQIVSLLPAHCVQLFRHF